MNSAMTIAGASLSEARRAAADAAAPSALPIATLCCWPPDSEPAGASSLSRTAGNSEHTRSNESTRQRARLASKIDCGNALIRQGPEVDQGSEIQRHSGCISDRGSRSGSAAGDDPHLGAAARAAEREHLVDAGQQLGPRLAGGAAVDGAQ
ncbi:MAG: hypothetical protein ABI585_12770 [Betaproteobacteria bacterium]